MSNQAIADCEQHVIVGGSRQRQVVLQDADSEATDDIDEQDQNAGDRVASDKLRRAIHRAVEVCFLGDLRPAAARLVLADQAGVEVRIDGHLLARHRIQGEPRADFGDAPRAFGNDDEINDHQNGEHH